MKTLGFPASPGDRTDFVGAIRDDRELRSGIDLAVECVNVIYATRYQSAETGCRRDLNLS